MANPWLKKNPFLSAWLSAANAAAGSARGVAAGAAKRQSQAAAAQASQQVMDFWSSVLTGGVQRPAKRKTKR